MACGREEGGGAGLKVRARGERESRLGHVSGGKGRERDSGGERKVTGRGKGFSCYGREMKAMGRSAWREQGKGWCRMAHR